LFILWELYNGSIKTSGQNFAQLLKQKQEGHTAW
jgi:hypothetical protein